MRTGWDTFEIQDRLDPGHQHWSINTLTPFTRVVHDFGLIARFHDPATDQIIVLAAGIGENGTLAASETLTDKGILETFRQKGVLPRSYQNLEAVIETEMIDGKPGPPRILAIHTW